MFTEGCRDWRLLDEANQTWPWFKLHFTGQERDRTELATASTTGYGRTAFHVQSTDTSPSLKITDHEANAATVLPSGPELLALLVELRNLRATAKPNHPATGAQSHPTRLLLDTR
jgi:hypothetical protein